ncbi:hypothetical protein KPL74_05755 [Bacillus sp. NP157]|nr:hypothetical protein KPL74_05755 [Bacillus sp. NP157]
MSTTRLYALADRLLAWFDALALRHAARRARVDLANNLPDLLERLGRGYAPLARRHGVAIELDVDPALEGDLDGPHARLGEAIAVLLVQAIRHGHDEHGHVALRVDVVRDAPSRQTVHFTVVGASEEPHARHVVQALGGTFHVEPGATPRAIVELEFVVPPRPPHIDIDALRMTLGGDAAMREVVATLDHALTTDLRALDAMLASADALAIQQWLHRVSGALGMAEATTLASTGIRLEHAVATQPLAEVEAQVRRFAADASWALARLRAVAAGDPL